MFVRASIPLDIRELFTPLPLALREVILVFLVLLDIDIHIDGVTDVDLVPCVDLDVDVVGIVGVVVVVAPRVVPVSMVPLAASLLVAPHAVD